MALGYGMIPLARAKCTRQNAATLERNNVRLKRFIACSFFESIRLGFHVPCVGVCLFVLL